MLNKKMFHGTADIIWDKPSKVDTLYLTSSYDDAMQYAVEATESLLQGGIMVKTNCAHGYAKRPGRKN